MIDNISLAGITSLHRGDVAPITVVTGLKYNASLVKMFNNCTFIYDPNWTYEEGNPTYPIAFFYVKSQTEQMSSQISQKPMLFYNSGTDTNDATKGAVTNIVADNIITQPKTYKFDVVVPANGTTLKNTSFSYDSVADVNGFLFSGGKIQGVNSVALALRVIDSITATLFRGLYGSSINATVITNALLSQQDYNKNSLEYMWRNRRILKFKMWNGWKFKYLVIKDLDLTKTGENGDYYEGTITCQEVPILTFKKQEKSRTLSVLGNISSQLGKMQIRAVSSFIEKMEATYEGRANANEFSSNMQVNR